MPRTQRVKRSRGRASRGQQSLHKTMKDLVELQKAQEIRFVPEIPDVPRIRLKPNKPYSVELSFMQTVALSTTVASSGGITFSLSSSAISSNYTAVFDQYRILQCNVKIIPVGVSTAGGNVLYTVLDYDDPSPPVSMATMLGYANLKIAPSGVIEERTLTPRLALAAYSGTAFTAYANAGPEQWLDAASSGIPYYGLKYFTPVAANGSSLQFIVTMMVQFRSQHG